MTRLISTAFIVAFAACGALKLAGNSGDRLSREIGTVTDRAGGVPQSSAEGGSTVDAILRASSLAGKNADVQISNAIGTMAHRSGIVWADYSTNQTWVACPTWGTQNITLVLYPVTYTIATNCTIPSNVTAVFSRFMFGSSRWNNDND